MFVHKAWNLKYDTTEMTAAINEDCIGWLLVKGGNSSHLLGATILIYILGAKGDTWHMILGDNPAGHGLCIKGLSFNWAFSNKS